MVVANESVVHSGENTDGDMSETPNTPEQIESRIANVSSRVDNIISILSSKPTSQNIRNCTVSILQVYCGLNELSFPENILKKIQTCIADSSSKLLEIAPILANNPSNENISYCVNVLRQISQGLKELNFFKNHR